MQVLSANDIKVYNLGASRALPEWLSDRKKRIMRKKEPEFQKRVELIQDLGMPTLSTYITTSPDEQYLFTLGVYKPRLRCYELENMALKFERCLDVQARRILFLEEDYSKFVLLEDDRWIEFHAREGHYAKLRVPSPGRDLAFCPPTCDLFIVGESDKIFRINLAQGRFLAPFQTTAESISCCAYNEQHGLLLCGTDDGKVEGWDPRSRRRISSLDVASVVSTFGVQGALPAVTALKFRDPLNIGLGTSNGMCHLYDIRQNQPWMSKDHGYGFPIRTLAFQENEQVISIDKRSVKIWNQEDGQTWTGFEPGESLNHLHYFPGTGLFMIANESPKVLSYFIPLLGDAPRWCHHLNRLVEECEPEVGSVYDDYKFVCRPELEALGLSHLIGSEFLRAYMHGFFIDNRLYTKAKSLSTPFSSVEHRQAQVRKLLAETRKSRLMGDSGENSDEERPKPLVNPDLADKVHDSRFQVIFEDDEFAINPDDEEFALLDLANRRAEKKEKKKAARHAAALKSQKLVDGDDLDGDIDDDDDDD